MREPVLSIGESAPTGAAQHISPHARVVSTNEYDADRGCRAEDFQVVTSEFAKRFAVIGKAALTATAEDDAQCVSVPGYGTFVPADVAGTIMEPVVSRRGVERWRPRAIRNATELRAYNESEFGQHKRAMESSGNPFDDDVGVGASPSPTALIDQHEFIPFLNGPFYKQLYIYDYLLMHARAFQLVNHNALAASAVKMLTRFTLGRGVSFHIKHDQARSVWQEFWDRNNMRRRIQQAARDLTWQGELLFRFYESDGFVTLRVLDASVCWEIVTDPEDIDHVYYYHCQWPAPYQLYTTGQIPVTRYIIQQIPPTNIQHVKINCSSMEKRGRSDLMPGMSWLKRIDDYYNGETLKRVLGANLVWTITVKGDQADVDSFLSNPNLTTLPPAGGVWIQNESVTLEPQVGSMSEGRGGAQIGGELSNLFATSVNLPGEYFNISGERGSARATALVRTDPAVKTIESRQQLLQEEIEDIYLRVMEAAYNAGRLSLQDATEEPERQDAGAFDDVGGEHDERVLRTIGKPRARLVQPVRAQPAPAAQRAQVVSRSTVHRGGTTPPPVRAHAAGQPSTPVIRAHAAGQPSEPVTRAHAAGTPSHALATSEIVGNGDGAVRAEIVSHARRIRVPRTPVH